MSDLPTPINRNEQYLNAIANGDPSDLPTPISREEQYLDYIARNGGGSGGAGVSSFNGRTGAVQPKAGDYTAEDVGALPADTPIPSVDEAPTQNSTNAVQSGGVYSAEKALSDTMAANGAHNLLPLTLEGLKAVNTTGTWNGNSYTDSSVTFTVTTNDAGYVTEISASGSASLGDERLFIAKATNTLNKYSGTSARSTPAP